MKTLATTAEVIEALGGTMAVARLTGRRMTAVSNWRRRRETFPANTFLTLTRALASAGCDAPTWLWGMAPKPKRPRAKVA
jgi:hypothetical protein